MFGFEVENRSRARRKILSEFFYTVTVSYSLACHAVGAPNGNIVQNHLNIAVLNVF